MYNIIGHEALRNSLIKAIESQTLSHAHIFVGEDGIGKSLVAKELSLNILGKKDMRQYADIMEFRNDKKSIGVNEIRNIIEEVSKKPYEGDKKVILIYEGDKLTTQAQNAFLKTVEEPPQGVFIIILVESSGSILDTIKSRCQIYKLNRLSDEDMLSFLSTKYPQVDETLKNVIINFSGGIPGRAEKFIKDEKFNHMRDITIKLLIDINQKNLIDIIKYEEQLIKYKDSYEEIIMNILCYVRDIIIYKEIGKESYLINQDKITDIKELSNMMSFNKLNSIAKLMEDIRYSLDSNVSMPMTFDVMLLNMMEV